MTRKYEIWLDDHMLDAIEAENEATAASQVIYDQLGLEIVESVIEGSQKVTLTDPDENSSACYLLTQKRRRT